MKCAEVKPGIRIWAADRRFSEELSADPFGTNNGRWKVPHTFTTIPDRLPPPAEKREPPQQLFKVGRTI